jgi:uncharacterized damage-inducible protein DinB
MEKVVGSIEAEYRRYKALAEDAIAQVAEEQLGEVRGSGGNSIATLVWHVSGNLASRFTDLLQSDGEKPWRDRESEFEKRTVSRSELTGKWNEGWGVLFGALAGLDDERLGDRVAVRGVGLSVLEALLRSLAHVSYHVGQIVFLAKDLQGKRWQYLTIPPGGSAAYNANPVREKPPGSPR